jgi:hypothetical protein
MGTALIEPPPSSTFHFLKRFVIAAGKSLMQNVHSGSTISAPFLIDIAVLLSHSRERTFDPKINKYVR